MGHEHKWMQIRMPPYYKLESDAEHERLNYNQTISYARLFCEICGGTMEVVAQDHRMSLGDLQQKMMRGNLS